MTATFPFWAAAFFFFFGVAIGLVATARRLRSVRNKLELRIERLRWELNVATRLNVLERDIKEASEYRGD